MNRLKVMTVVGTRPEIIRLARVIAVLNESVDHTLVHTGQNYDFELNEVFFRDLKLPNPNIYLNAAGASASETIGNIISKIDPILANVQPDALLVLGDTNSCLAAISAKKRKIPIFHMEAGNRCFDQRVPEESNRKIVDHLSDINMTYSQNARDYLLREGLAPDRIIVTGSPMQEVLSHFKPEIEKSTVLSKLGLEPNGYFVVSAHREENVDSPKRFESLMTSLRSIAEKYNKPIIFSAHPRTKKRLDEVQADIHKQIQIMKPLGFHDYIKLQLNAFAVLSDSGTITEESSILNFPALNIREAHERPEGMEEASVMMTGLSPGRILQALKVLDRQTRGPDRNFRLPADYSANNVSEKVLRILISYTDYVRRVVWQE